ncbi:hypothetical protein FJ251_08845 [bacterium]|nr:hypothetical protein [bacterium]
MKPGNQVHVKVLRSTVASSVTLAAGEEAYISETDFRVLFQMGKVEPIRPAPEPAPAAETKPAEDETIAPVAETKPAEDETIAPGAETAESEPKDTGKKGKGK